MIPNNGIISRKKLFLIFFAILIPSGYLIADDVGTEILRKNGMLKKPSTVISRSVMVVIRGQTKEIKEFTVFSKRYAESLKTRMFFTKPVKLDFISWSEPSKKAKQWINLSGKFQEIASSDSRAEFMGSHFYFEDLAEFYPENYSFEYLGDETIGNVPCYKVEARKKSGAEVYVKTIIYVRKSDNFIIQYDFFEKRGQTKSLVLDQIEVLDGIVLARKATMKRIGSQDKTIIYIKDVLYNNPVSDGAFQP